MLLDRPKQQTSVPPAVPSTSNAPTRVRKRGNKRPIPSVSSVDDDDVNIESNSDVVSEDSDPNFENPWKVKAKRKQKLKKLCKKSKKKHVPKAKPKSPRKVSKRKKTTVVLFSSSSDSEFETDDESSSDSSDSSDEDRASERNDRPSNAPRLPKGSDRHVTIDQCLSDSFS